MRLRIPEDPAKCMPVAAVFPHKAMTGDGERLLSVMIEEDMINGTAHGKCMLSKNRRDKSAVLSRVFYLLSIRP